VQLNRFAADSSIFFGCKRASLLLQEDFDSTCRPDGDTGTKKIGIFCPDGTAQAKGGSEHRPAGFVSHAQSLAGIGFKDAVKFARDRLNQAAQVFERRILISLGLVPFF